VFFGEEGRIKKLLCVFCCLEEKKKCVEKLGSEKNSEKKNVVSPGLRDA